MDRQVRLKAPDQIGGQEVTVLLSTVEVWLEHGFSKIEDENYDEDTAMDPSQENWTKEVDDFYQKNPRPEADGQVAPVPVPEPEPPLETVPTLIQETPESPEISPPVPDNSPAETSFTGEPLDVSPPNDVVTPVSDNP